jgi:hypothetical protein
MPFSEFGAFGAATGTRSQDVIDIELQKMAPGIYRVVPRQPLKPGEYGFFYAGANMAMGTTGGQAVPAPYRAARSGHRCPHSAPPGKSQSRQK